MEQTWYKGYEKRQKESNNFRKTEPAFPLYRGVLGASASAPLLPSPVSPSKPLSSTAQSFLARQAKTSQGMDIRVSTSKTQMLVAKTYRAVDDVGFWGAQGVPGFRTYLIKKFGSIIAGWRELDRDKNGRLTFYEFCNACRRMGYHGNLKQLWNDLDKNLNGSVSLSELDPEAGKLIGEFKLALMNKYGDMVTAWKKGIDTNGNGRIDEPEIEAAVKRLGLKMNPHKLFAMLRCSPGKHSPGLTFKDFDPEAYDRMDVGDIHGLVHGPDKEFIEDLEGMGKEVEWPEDVKKARPTDGARKWRQQLREEDLEFLKKMLGDIANFSLGVSEPEGFRRALIGRCGSLLGAWRHALDLDGNGRLTPGEYLRAMDRLGFHGDLKGLYHKLDKEGKGYVNFADLDKATDAALTELKEKLAEKYGNMLLAWVKGLDRRGTGCVSKSDFQRTCRDAGYANSARLFRKLKPEAGRNFLTLKDFDTKAFLALSRGDFRMISEPETKSKPKMLSMSFEERQNSGFYHQIRKAWDASRRAEFQKALLLANTPEHLIDTHEEFEHLCIRNYGTVIQAWHKCLDLDHNGRLTFNEFCTACRRIGYAGELKGLWSELGGKETGHLTLKDLDPQAEELVTSFLELLKERYGHIDNAWKKGFGKDPHDSIDEKELTKACEVMGYSHSAKKLFKCLIPDKGKVLLTLWDIDPMSERERARGGGLIAAPKDPHNMGGAGNQGHNFGEAESPEPRHPKHYKVDLAKKGLGVQAARTSMRNMHGCTAAAWRAVFGVQTTRIDFYGFCRLLRNSEFDGSFKDLWKEVARQDVDSNQSPAVSSTAKPGGNEATEEDEDADPKQFTTFGVIDPTVQAILKSARSQLVERFGTLRAIWKEMSGLAAERKAAEEKAEAEKRGDPPGDPEKVAKLLTRVNFASFIAWCQQIGLELKKPGTPELLFKLLKSHNGQRSLVFKDLETLLIGVPVEEHAELRGEAPPKPPEKSIKAHLDEQLKDLHQTDLIVRHLESFKKLLIRTDGSLFAAWRGRFDLDDNGVVTRAEFSQGCRTLGVRNVRELWRELCPADGVDQITLAELDPVVTELFGELVQLLVERYGSTVKGWRKNFEHAEKTAKQVDKAKFVRRCKELGMQGNAALLFKLLRPDHARKHHLVYEDLWRSLNKNATYVDKPGGKNGATFVVARPAPKAPEGLPEEKQEQGPAEDPLVLVEDLVAEALAENAGVATHAGNGVAQLPEDDLPAPAGQPDMMQAMLASATAALAEHARVAEEQKAADAMAQALEEHAGVAEDEAAVDAVAEAPAEQAGVAEDEVAAAVEAGAEPELPPLEDADAMQDAGKQEDQDDSADSGFEDEDEFEEESSGYEDEFEDDDDWRQQAESDDDDSVEDEKRKTKGDQYMVAEEEQPASLQATVKMASFQDDYEDDMWNDQASFMASGTLKLSQASLGSAISQSHASEAHDRDSEDEANDASAEYYAAASDGSAAEGDQLAETKSEGDFEAASEDD